MIWPRYLPVTDPAALPPAGVEKCVALENKLDAVAAACAADPEKAKALCNEQAGAVAQLLAASLAVPGYAPPKWVAIWQPKMRFHLCFQWFTLSGNKIGVTLSYGYA